MEVNSHVIMSLKILILTATIMFQQISIISRDLFFQQTFKRKSNWKQLYLEARVIKLKQSHETITTNHKISFNFQILSSPFDTGLQMIEMF